MTIHLNYAYIGEFTFKTDCSQYHKGSKQRNIVRESVQKNTSETKIIKSISMLFNFNFMAACLRAQITLLLSAP